MSEKQYYHNLIHSSNVEPFDDNDLPQLRIAKIIKHIEHVIHGKCLFLPLSLSLSVCRRNNFESQIGQLPSV